MSYNYNIVVKMRVWHTFGYRELSSMPEFMQEVSIGIDGFELGSNVATLPLNLSGASEILIYTITFPS